MTKEIDEDVIRAQLDKTLGETNFPELGEKYEGKVRDCYVRDGRRTLIATDPDQRLRRRARDDSVQGARAEPDGRILVRGDRRPRSEPRHQCPRSDGDRRAGKCQLLPVEFVMRAYLTGVTSTSIWTHYSNT